MVLGGQPPGRVGHRQRDFFLYLEEEIDCSLRIFLDRYRNLTIFLGISKMYIISLISRTKVVRVLPTVELRPNESQEQLLRRFRKKVAKSGVLSAVRRKRWHVSKSELRRIQRKKAIRRRKRILRSKRQKN